MELQWPLIIFTTLVSWCAGTFATQAYLALKGTGQKAQIRCWIVSAVLLVVGGIAEEQDVVCDALQPHHAPAVAYRGRAAFF